MGSVRWCGDIAGVIERLWLTCLCGDACRALDLALQHKTHVDTVLAYRQRSLRASKRVETNERFIQFNAEVSIDWDAIKAKITQEKERERDRAGAGGHK